MHQWLLPSSQWAKNITIANLGGGLNIKTKDGMETELPSHTYGPSRSGVRQNNGKKPGLLFYVFVYTWNPSVLSAVNLATFLGNKFTSTT